MGDRVSIAFRNNGVDSVTLFSHWGGREFVDKAEDYCEALIEKVKSHYLAWLPIGRLEPQTVMVDFIRSLTTGQNIVGSDLYLGKDEFDGDNSDNGHYILEFQGNKVKIIEY